MPQRKVTVPPCLFRRAGHRWLFNTERSTASSQAEVCEACDATPGGDHDARGGAAFRPPDRGSTAGASRVDGSDPGHGLTGARDSPRPPGGASAGLLVVHQGRPSARHGAAARGYDNVRWRPRPGCVSMTRRKLPIGMQTFRKIREGRCYYVDKTAYIRQLLDEGEHYFLSRPRRFGKSLFLDTCKELFEGNEPLFEGLAIHDRWDWSVRHPVLRLSFGSGNFKEPGYLHTNLMAQLDVLEEQLGVGSRYDTAAERFGHLVRMSSARAGQRAVILVDEYDKPILDALDAPEVARANRDFLRGLYAVVKDSDAHIRFSFITGVSKFSKVSLFSGLNNLTDITLEPGYSAICGYNPLGGRIIHVKSTARPIMPGSVNLGPGSGKAALTSLRRVPAMNR